MLSQGQHEEFDRLGLIRLPAAIPSADAAAMRNRIWSFLHDRDAIERDNVSSWPAGPIFGFHQLSRSGAFAPLGSATISAAIDDLIGKGRWRREGGRVLVTFPQPDIVWTVPDSAWHVDYIPLQEEGGTRAVQLFVVLDYLRSEGGATLVLTGSHRLVNRYVATSGREPRPRAMKSALGSAHQWLAELWGSDTDAADMDVSSRIRRYMDEGAVIEDVRVVVRELCGAAGDVFIMNSDCFHTAAPNCQEKPRMMLTSIATREGER